jgi:hypothetical protein
MSTTRRLLACTCIVLVTMLMSSCSETGIGMGVPTSGARWSGPGNGPGVIVRGGPVYR